MTYAKVPHTNCLASSEQDIANTANGGEAHDHVSPLLNFVRQICREYCDEEGEKERRCRQTLGVNCGKPHVH